MGKGANTFQVSFDGYEHDVYCDPETLLDAEMDGNSGEELPEDVEANDEQYIPPTDEQKKATRKDLGNTFADRDNLG